MEFQGVNSGDFIAGGGGGTTGCIGSFQAQEIGADSSPGADLLRQVMQLIVAAKADKKTIKFFFKGLSEFIRQDRQNSY